MKLKNVWLRTLMVCVCSLFLLQNLAFGYSKAWQTEENELDIKYRAVSGASTKLVKYRDALGTLTGKWSANEKKIAAGAEVTLAGVLTTSASTLALYLTGGSAIPVYMSAVLTLKSAVDVGLGISGSDSYVSAIQTADSAVEDAVEDVEEAYKAYTTQYSVYLSKCAAHNLVRFTGDTPSGVYSQSALDTAVNMSNKTRGWYHTFDSPSGTDHSIDPRYDSDHWDMRDAPHDYECKGACPVTFRSPYSALMAHREKCGAPETKTVTHLADYNTRMALLAIRTVAQGCGETWYTCDSDAAQQAAWHQVRTCVKDYTNSSGVKAPCGVRFIRCLGHTRDHNESDRKRTKTLHSDVAESSSPIVSPPPTPTPTDGTPNCPDCTSHCAPPCLCTNSGTCNGSVYYHVCGEHETTVSGDHSLQASCSLTDANGNSCTVTNFYACQSHTCVFPAPPPPPPTVSCGRSGCSESVSSANEHRVGPCSACGQSYWSCSWSASYWANEHRLRTCRYGTCGQTWRRCQSSTPNCLSPNRQGERCWAADP